MTSKECDQSTFEDAAAKFENVPSIVTSEGTGESAPSQNHKKEEEVKEEPKRERRNDGCLEGMDPVTGDYIRIPKDEQRSIGANQTTKKQPQFLDPSRLDEGEYTNTRSAAKSDLAVWSRRLAHTLSNKDRQHGMSVSVAGSVYGGDDEWEEEEEGANNCIFGHQIRFTIMAISTLCLSSILSNILTFNFTYICMAGERPPNFSENNEKMNGTSFGNYNPNLDYSSAERSALFMAVAVGALLTVFPLTLLLNKFGSRMVFGCLGYLSAFATLLVPLAAVNGFPFILAMRFLQGVSFSACLPVMGSITSHWSTLKQNGIFIAILSSFLQIAPIFTMPVAGELCTSTIAGGWPSVYYLHGLVCIVLFTIFMLYHRNLPHEHPMMGRKELVKVMFNKGGSIYSGPGRKRRKKAQKVPYAAMYSDTAIWAILVASFGNFMGTQLSLQFMPTYINKVLLLPIEQTGMASAISPAIMFVIKLVAGQSSDKIKIVSDKAKLRIYNTLSLSMMGVLFIVLSLLDPRTNSSLCLTVLIAATCILGFNSGGFFKSSQIVSRQHSHFTLANISFINCVCMLLVPLLNEAIAPENDPDNWATVLWIHGIVLNVTNAFFCIFVSARPARWALETFGSKTRSAQRRKRGGDGGGERVAKRGKVAPEVENNKRFNVIRVVSPELPSVY